MLSYLLKLLYLVVFSILVIFVYYKIYDFHVESFVWYTPYVIAMLIFYACYKGYQFLQAKKEIIFTPVQILFFFLLQLFLLSFLFFTLNEWSASFGFTLFFKIIGYCLLPIIIFSISSSFWKFLLNKIQWFQTETSTFQFLSSLWVGFFVFMTFLSIFWFFWWYNIYVFCTIIISMWIISYKEYYQLCKAFIYHEIKIPDETFLSEAKIPFWKFNLYLYSTEFLFIVLSFLLSVNFINIVRPMPIWWDDLWVYMNFPNIMANAGSTLDLWWMYAWQVFTWIWYMFSAGTASFFLNTFWGILSLIVIVLSTSELLKSSKKTFINIPLLLGTLFLSMPMVIFQLAKDMKLDPGLFFISAITIYMTFYIFMKYIGYKKETTGENFRIISETQWDKNTIEVVFNKKTKHWFSSYFTSFTHIWEDIFSKKQYLIYMFIIWILAWFAFSIKFTSLLLISSLIWVIFYAKLWVAWFLAYISFYVAIFTKAKLWAMMNVVVPTDISFVNNVFLFWMLFWVLFISYSLNKYSFEAIKKFFIILVLFLFWVILWVSPWITKNLLSSDTLSMWAILNGKSDVFEVDYTKIYSQEELDNINNQISQTSMTESWTSNNEDFWRYFWYEKWINNYLKLPYNLTMQSNQKGEYTDITFIYLALIPIILFLSYKSGFFAIWTFIYLLIPLFLFFPFFNNYFTDFFAQFELPVWYGIIFAFFLIPSLYLIYTLNKEKFSQLMRLNIIFWMWYIFLWAISAFWIVWYGIWMYYILLIIIGIWIHYISSYDNNDDIKNTTFKLFWSIIILLIISVYFFQSTFPHGFSNLKQASYAQFKAWEYNNYIAIFEAQPSYYNVLVELNIKKEKHSELQKLVLSDISNQQLKEIIRENNIDNLESLNQVLIQISNLANTENNLEIFALKKDAKKLRTLLYKNILYPSPEFKNMAWVYRIGTFLRYFIVNNYNRLYEDSLVTGFQNYFYDENNIDIALERMKKMWVDYFLVDLNAATIDKDPARNLTKRYENLLKTFTSNKIELVQSDSICLKLWLDEYNMSQKTQEDFEKYLTFAWVNYESYTLNWETINRWVKQLACYNRILELMQEPWLINEKNYSYLVPIVNYLNQNSLQTQEELVTFFKNYVWHGWMVLFKIK